MTVSTPPRAARGARQAWQELSSATPDPVLFDRAMLAELPGAARRYLAHALEPGTPLWQSVELSMAGQIRLGGWCRFTADQVISPHGYVWAADARVHHVPVLGYDRFSRGTGEMQWRALDLVPVVQATGADVTRSAAGRLAAEIVLLPTAFRGATWSSGGPDIAVATWGAGAEAQRVELRTDSSGRLLEVYMQRWGDPGGLPFDRYSFGVTVHQEQTWAGVTLPSSFSAGWHRRTPRHDEGEFFRAALTQVRFR